LLASLTIRNFVLIEDAVLEFGAGLTVLTGETGAGKTLLTHALGLLIGERAEGGLVGPAAEEASIQAVFELGDSEIAGLPESLRSLTGTVPGDTIVTRRLSKQGRNRCYVNDTAVTLGTMAELVSGLLSFAGQHEYRRLLEPGYQLAVLDQWAGTDVVELAVECRYAFEKARTTVRQLEEARRSQEVRLREIDLLRFEVGELSEARLSVAEERALLAEQRVLARAEDILRSAGAAAGLLAGDGDQPDVGALLAQAGALLAAVAGVDGALDAIASGLTEVRYQIAELSRELRSHLDQISVDPARLQEANDRLRLYTDLARKYGGSTVAALTRGEEAARRLAVLENIEEGLGRLEEGLGAQIAYALEAAASLSDRRRQAAPLLEQAVAAQLADLGMVKARVPIVVETREGWEGLTESGADWVEFLLAANPGQPPRSLSRTASGGELSRVLLAIKCALSGAGGAETLVFDEIDAGIGGRAAVAVGRKLRELADSSQLVVVTHLAHVAALAERHYLIEKIATDGATITRLTLISGDTVVEELCRMMGGRPDDAEAMAHAREVRDRATGGLLD
jgi:DNA repair protein RecN (Recombination protein N)